MKNSKVVFVDEIFKVEKAGSQMNIKDADGEEPEKRKLVTIFSCFGYIYCSD